jgi:hypothetical protein
VCSVEFELPFVESSEKYGSEVDAPDSIVDLFEADGFFVEHLADEQPSVVGSYTAGVFPANPAIVADATHFEVYRILGRGDSGRQRSRRGTVES